MKTNPQSHLFPILQRLVNTIDEQHFREEQ